MCTTIKQLPIQGWSICVDERDVDLDYKIQNEEKFGDGFSKETVCKIAKGLVKDWIRGKSRLWHQRKMLKMNFLKDSNLSIGGEH